MAAKPDFFPVRPGAHSTPYLLSKRATALAMALLALVWLAMFVVGPSSVGMTILQLSPAATDSTLASAALFFTQLENLLWPIGFFAAAFLAAQDRKLDAVLLAGSMLTERLLVYFQKVQLIRARPNSHLWLAQADGLAFPSGHAASSMLICTLSAVLLAPAERRKTALGAAIAMSICIGSSRVLLRVHWPTDVIAGWAFGLFWMLGSLMLLDHFRKAQRGPALL